MTTLLVTLAWADLVPPTVVSFNNILFYYISPRMSSSSTFLTTHSMARVVFNALANIFTTFSNWLIVLITTFRLIVVKVKISLYESFSVLSTTSKATKTFLKQTNQSHVFVYISMTYTKMNSSCFPCLIIDYDVLDCRIFGHTKKDYT